MFRVNVILKLMSDYSTNATLSQLLEQLCYNTATLTSLRQ